MAGDWIKMRTNLQRDPRVMRIVSACKADVCPQGVQKVSDRLRVIGALHAVWSLADEQTEDGRLDGYSYETLDEMIGWPGFCLSLESVGWISRDAQGVVFTRFDEHNGKSAKRRAQDSGRKKVVRKLSAETSAPKADKKQTREEKRREEKNQAAALPEWVPSDAWDAFEEMREKRRNGLTDRARQLAVAELQRLRDEGNDPRAVIERAVLKGWMTFYPLNGSGPPKPIQVDR